MNKEEAKQHFDLKKATRPLKEFTIGNYLFHVQLATDNWSKLDSSLNLETAYFHIGKVTNQDGAVLRRIILWRLSITWGRLDQ